MRNKANTRQCIVCRKKKDKKDLFRVCLIEKKLILDKNNNLQQRGVYICKDEGCMHNSIKHKSYNRAFKTSINDEELKCLNKEFEFDK